MNQLIPPIEFAPVPRRDLTPAQSVLAWFDLMKMGEQFWLANLHRQLKPGQTIQDAVRKNYARWMEEHDQKLIAMARRFGKANGS